MNKVNNSFDARKLLDSLVYVQKCKAQVMDNLWEMNKELEYTDILERAIETHWSDCVYYVLDGRQVNAGDLMNQDNLLELYYSGMGFMPAAFYEERFNGNWEVGLK